MLSQLSRAPSIREREEEDSKQCGVCLPVIIEHLCKHARMSIEKVLVEDGIVISECFGEARESSGGNFLQRRFISLVSNAADVEHHSILRVHVHHVIHFGGAAKVNGNSQFYGVGDAVNLITLSVSHSPVNLSTLPRLRIDKISPNKFYMNCFSSRS
jgi:hypothetical protein